MERNVTEIRVIKHASRAAATGTDLPNATLTELERWEDDGGAVPPKTTPRTEADCDMHRTDTSKDSSHERHRAVPSR